MTTERIEAAKSLGAELTRLAGDRSHGEIARKVGCCPGYVSRILKGRVAASRDTVRRVFSVLGGDSAAFPTLLEALPEGIGANLGCRKGKGRRRRPLPLPKAPEAPPRPKKEPRTERVDFAGSLEAIRSGMKALGAKECTVTAEEVRFR